ncbi:WbqC family protein [Candidatus Curtissbacteria bacterium]|nr:WbqC family protein [Candidatus Curtissbacteria bacterium]
MRYSGIQPQYFPRLHYFARILNTGIFVVRDDVQFVRKHKYPDGRVDKSYQAHTPIKQAFGIQFLDVPTKHGGYLSCAETRISYDDKLITRHLKSIRVAYGRARNFDRLYNEIERLLQRRYGYLGGLNFATIGWGLLHLLGEEQVDVDKISIGFLEKKLAQHRQFRLKKIKEASKSKALMEAKNLTANEKIITLIKEVGADEDYCGGTGAAAYMDGKLFERNGIKITIQDWKCPEYQQQFTNQLGFIPNLSIIDLLMNVDENESADIISR